MMAPVLPLGAQTTRHRFSSAYADGVFHTQNVRAFASRIASLGAQQAGVEVVSNSALKPMAEVLPALRNNEIQFGEVLMSTVADKLPLLGLDALPFIVRGFEDAEHMWRVSRKPIGEQLLAQGARLLYAVPWPAQGLYCRRPVQKLEDLKDLKLRVYNDATRRLAELSGAEPVVIAAHELPAALEKGGVDAMLTSSTTGVDSQAWKAMKVFIDMRAWIPKNMVCMSEQLWQSLDDAGRQSIVQAAEQAEADGWRMAREADDVGKKTLAGNGMDVTTPSTDLRRSLDFMGERFGREWTAKSGVRAAVVLLDYYNARSA